MDIGRSINPALDYGQIEGAFVQGQGLFTMEESLWTKTGELFTKGPGTYKIPGKRKEIGSWAFVSLHLADIFGFRILRHSSNIQHINLAT